MLFVPMGQEEMERLKLRAETDDLCLICLTGGKETQAAAHWHGEFLVPLCLDHIITVREVQVRAKWIAKQ